MDVVVCWHKIWELVGKGSGAVRREVLVSCLFLKNVLGILGKMGARVQTRRRGLEAVHLTCIPKAELILVCSQ